MREIIYYLDDPETDERKVTVCLLSDNGRTARGIALCNFEGHYDEWKDEMLGKGQFNRKRGLQIARGRAIKALKQMKTCRRNKIAERASTMYLPNEFISKCTYMPELTIYETSLLAPPTPKE